MSDARFPSLRSVARRAVEASPAMRTWAEGLGVDAFRRGPLAPSPPRPRGLPWHVPMGTFERLDHLMKISLAHGDVVRLEFPKLTAHLLSHPDHVQRVLIDDHRRFSKQTRGYETLRLFLGNGLVTSEGEFWLRQRRIAQPAFHRKRIAGFADGIVRAAADLGRAWAPRAASGETVDVAAEMMQLTLRIAGETMLSADPSGQAGAVGAALEILQKEVNRRLDSPWVPPVEWPTPHNRRLRAATEQLDRIVLDLIDRRRRGREQGDDLLQMLLEARDEETGAGMDDRQLRDEVMTVFLAGHETTSNALTWTFYLLSRAPQIARALHEEAVRVLGDRPATFDDLPALDLTRRVLQESMRLYPPVWILGRSPTEDLDVDGYRIPRGSLVFLSQWVTHRHPKWWENPEGFDPDRWLPERMRGLHRHQYFPFAAGPRMCIGAGLAQMEGQLVLATLARHYRVQPVPGQRVEPEPLITLRPRGGLPSTLHRID